MPEKDIYVSVPSDVLKTLFEIAHDYPLLCAEVKALSRRLDCFYALTSEFIPIIDDLFRR